MLDHPRIHAGSTDTRLLQQSPTGWQFLSGAVIDFYSAEAEKLVTRPDLVRKWPALPIMFGRDVDRLPELYQPLYDLLVRHANAQSSNPRDKVFSLLGLVPPDERVWLLRNFPDYKLSVELVSVTHVRSLVESFYEILHVLIFAVHRSITHQAAVMQDATPQHQDTSVQGVFR
jgi:hypothetical protein